MTGHHQQKRLRDIWKEPTFWIGLGAGAFLYIAPRVMIILCAKYHCQEALDKVDGARKIKDWAEFQQSDILIIVSVIIMFWSAWPGMFSWLKSTRLPWIGKQ